MNHCFGSAGWIVLCVILEDFVALLPYFRKCGNIARKTAFCLATGILKIMGSSLKLLGGRVDLISKRQMNFFFFGLLFKTAMGKSARKPIHEQKIIGS